MRDKRRDARASGDVWLLVPESAVAPADPGAYAAPRQDYRRVCVCVCGRTGGRRGDKTTRCTGDSYCVWGREAEAPQQHHDSGS